MYTSVYTLDFLILPLLSHTWSRSSRQTNLATDRSAPIDISLANAVHCVESDSGGVLMPRSLSMMLYTTSLQSSSSLSLMLLNLRFSRLVYCSRFVFRSTSSFRLCSKSDIFFLAAPFPRCNLHVEGPTCKHKNLIKEFSTLELTRVARVRYKSKLQL